MVTLQLLFRRGLHHAARGDAPGVYLLYRMGVLVLSDLGHPNAAGLLMVVWLAFCVYTWVGPALFQKQLARELEPATLHSKY